jgi:hypothetical protein
VINVRNDGRRRITMNVTIGLRSGVRSKKKRESNGVITYDAMKDWTHEYHSHELVSVLKSKESVLRPLWEVFEVPMREYNSM